MQEKFIILLSDRVSRYNTKFSIGGLKSGLDQKWQTGMPSFISHDWHRLLGWTQITSLFLEPGLARLTGIFSVPENDEENETLSQSAKLHILKNIEKNVEPYYDEFKLKIGDYLTGKEKFYDPGCAALCDKELAQKVFPEIFEKKDKDGLIPLKCLKIKAPGVFEINGLLLFAHPYFRRSLSRLNAINDPFFQVLDKLSLNQNCDIRIALDEDMIGLSNTFLQAIELEYWWGPKFSDNLSGIPKGVTVHKADESLLFYHGIYKTDFWWHAQNKMDTFECEEIKNLPSRGVSNEKFGCRYVHCILAPSEGVNMHLDGAIRMYDEESMIARIENTIDKAGRNTEYKKLWRVDGSISISEWKELVTHYFRDNRLIGEYLGAKEESEEEQSAPAHQLDKNPYLPSNMEAGQGVRISLSYRQIEKKGQPGRYLTSFDYLSEGLSSDEKYYVEADTIEIIKILRADGETVFMPENLIYLAYEDMVLNLPIFDHIGPDSASIANITQKAIHKLVRNWESNKEDRLISYTIGIQFPDKIINFSFAGHITDMNIWLNATESSLPIAEDLVGEWCEKASACISSRFPESNNHPSANSLLKESGVLKFERYCLDPKDYNLNNNHSEIFELRLPRDHEISVKLTSGELKIAPAFIISGSVCSKCNESYFLCSCSKYLESNVSETVEDTTLIGVFLTNRKA